MRSSNFISRFEEGFLHHENRRQGRVQLPGVPGAGLPAAILSP